MIKTETVLDLPAIEARREAAHRTVCDLDAGARKWTMSIPAQPQYDPDLVIEASLGDVDRLVAEVQLLRQVMGNLLEADTRGQVQLPHPLWGHLQHAIAGTLTAALLDQARSEDTNAEHPRVALLAALIAAEVREQILRQKLVQTDAVLATLRAGLGLTLHAVQATSPDAV